MRAWREAHPEWADEHVMSRSEASEYAQSRIRPAIDQITQRLHQTQNDAVVAALAKELRELAYGKDAQALTLQHSTGPTVQIYIPGNDRDPETAAGAAGEIPKQSR